jgi:hypothetical protein
LDNVEKSLEIVDGKDRLWVFAANKEGKEEVGEVRRYCEEVGLHHEEVDCGNEAEVRDMLVRVGEVAKEALEGAKEVVREREVVT